MRIYVAPPAPTTVAVPTFRKTNIVRPSTIKAVKELKRLSAGVGGFARPSNKSKAFLIAGADLEVIERLLDFAYTMPSTVLSGRPRDGGVDGVGANTYGV